ncbi:MAG: hypothetical protein KGN79_11525 [Acidobacteriota bacterium]|nr:hypothetical protein [Acidobacteriota bacterium]
MKRSVWTKLSAVGASLLAMLLVPGAVAQCGHSLKTVKPATSQLQMGGVHLQRATLNRVNHYVPSIVGMWHVIFTAKTAGGQSIPDTKIDDALAVWHADNTEIMNSARPPQDGNFCLGVWVQTGRTQYFLNHIPWFSNGYPNSTQNGIGDPVGPTQITETVNLSSDGKSYSGTFTLTAYGLDKSVLANFTGVVQGTRINVSTPATSLF